MNKYYVRSRFYDNGKTEGIIFLESECYNEDKSNKELKHYDEYWDTFDTYEDAEQYLKDVKLA